MWRRSCEPRATRTAAPTIVPAVDFFGKIILISAFPKWDWLLSAGSPSPSISWNHRVSRKSDIKSWRSTTCGQNIDVKELTLRDSRIRSRSGTEARSIHCHGLDDDCKIVGLCARSDVTCGCGKRKAQGKLCPGVELPHSSQNRLEWATRPSATRRCMENLGETPPWRHWQPHHRAMCSCLQVASLCVGVGHGRYSGTQGHAEKLASPC